MNQKVINKIDNYGTVKYLVLKVKKSSYITLIQLAKCVEENLWWNFANNKETTFSYCKNQEINQGEKYLDSYL